MILTTELAFFIIINNDNDEGWTKLDKQELDFLLHPIRMRIIQHLTRRPATVQQLKEWMADIPQATLYRHVNALKDKAMIVVTESHQKRGTTEKTYALHKPVMTQEEVEKLTGEEHLQLLLPFLSNVTGQASEYLLSNPTVAKDYFGYSQVDLHVTKDEFQELQVKMNDLLQPLVANEPSDDRKKITLVQVVLPEPKKN
ncbi:helix-turn-helix domain-containing protein [Paenalkalicoccus suaedae]|uniref:Helix-turn-helix domain-containing protein n=1 Tax=Paenalkalicoccus suaedae TaxID=2592382 RepID=A0A859FJR2_9BACI|nr:helix-turn-helix domain-containing protein [Paenalkalicoccus suaedae]QKS73026.1 helix-turn-helix domain-containing protein [Paenalkalicoccus suaedae]